MESANSVTFRAPLAWETLEDALAALRVGFCSTHLV